MLITIEGGEGAGKTTQTRLLAESLIARGIDVLRTREPGGAPGAEALREFLLHQDHRLSLRAETLAHFAARADHVDATIRPALQAGRMVLCDRFTDSTMAYQGYGLGQGDPAILDFIERLAELLDIRPRLTLVLDIPRREGSSRLRQRGGTGDRYEALDDAFHDRVAQGFLAIARRSPGRCVLIPAAGSVAEVQQRLLTALEPLLRQ